MINENQKTVKNDINLLPVEDEIKKESSKNYRWLWTLVVVPVLIAIISNWEKFFPKKKETSESTCEYLNKKLSGRINELENIKNLLKNVSSEDYLKLSSDSISHSIQIIEINKQLKENKCKN